MSKEVGETEVTRNARFETFEDRLVLSAQSVADFYVDGFSSEQVLEQYSEIAPTLADAHDASGVTYVQDNFGFNGSSQTVAVIDTGIAWDHYALGGGLGENYRVVGGWDFAENDADPYDDGPAGFHGTHVSGIIGSSDSEHQGVASGVDLVGLRVFNDQGAGYLNWVEEALQWVHDHKDDFENPITTVNLSLGTNWNADTVPGWAMLEEEFAQLEADGIFISVAAGNGFANYQTTGVSYPAASPHVVPVASHGADGTLSGFSQRNDAVIAAPGENITSTVPGHIFGSNGASSQFMAASGTSMAAPYMAGASVLMRDAMEFMGYTDIDQEMIYEHFRQTADQVWDSVTHSSYHRLNLKAAMDALITDQHGDSFATGTSLGMLHGGESFSGTIGQFGDQDDFSFTADADGRVTFNLVGTHDLSADWSTTGANVSVAGDTISFDVVAGQSYSLGLGTNQGLGHYDISVEMQASDVTITPVEWGAVSSAKFAGESISGESWFQFSAERDGILTVEALFSQANGALDFEIYDATGNLVGSSGSSSDNERLDVVVNKGDSLTLKVRGQNDQVDFRLTNLVGLDQGLLSVAGTEGNDVFSFTAGGSYVVTVNGLEYQFESGDVSRISVDGGGGSDQLTVNSNSGNDSVNLRVGQVDVQNGGYRLDGTGIETIVVNGGGGWDTIKVFDSMGDDHLVATPDSVTLTGAGFSNSANGFSRVDVTGSGGLDTAKLHDSVGNDRFTGRADYSNMRGQGFNNTVRGFDEVQAISENGGRDIARIYDSKGDDHFRADSFTASMIGTGFHLQADGFDRVYAFATSGGHDTAELYDSAGNDLFLSRSNYSMMRGNGFLNYARGFEQVVGYATAGGAYDRAYFYDSVGDDIFEAHSTYASMRGGGVDNQAFGFSRVYAFARYGGNDQAIFHDSVGDDRFYSRPGVATMRGSGYYNFARGFESVAANSTSGNDYAYLRGSRGADRLDVHDSSVALSSGDKTSQVNGFGRVNVNGGGGAGSAVFHELGSGDSVNEYGRRISAKYGSMNLSAYGFEYFVANDDDSDDSDDVKAVDELFAKYGKNDA